MAPAVIRQVTGSSADLTAQNARHLENTCMGEIGCDVSCQVRN